MAKVVATVKVEFTQDEVRLMYERVKDLEAALHALVTVEPTFGTDTGIYCVSCDAEQLSFVEPLVHTPDCPWVKGRALLKGER